jgi:hypothetical protein
MVDIMLAGDEADPPEAVALSATRFRWDVDDHEEHIVGLQNGAPPARDQRTPRSTSDRR